MTMQRPDTIIYNDEQRIIYSQPLKPYFESLEQKPVFLSMVTSMTSRGYYAGWLLKNNQLYLIDFLGLQLTSNWTELEYNLTDLFPKEAAPIFAHWFSGQIIIPLGKNISTSMYSRYERHLILYLDKGMFINEEEVSA